MKQASIKNFILVEDSKDEEVSNRNLLVFGKVDDSTFSLEYFHPLSPFQAFGIAVSQFDFKLNCEWLYILKLMEIYRKRDDKKNKPDDYLKIFKEFDMDNSGGVSKD